MTDMKNHPGPASLFAQARFASAEHDPLGLPAETGPEVAFAGRSNAGKSSAINAICNRRQLARVGKTPGRTQSINFFDLGHGRMIDLPGYGFARVPRKVQASWKKLIESYLTRRHVLQGVVLIMDCRRPLTDFDRQLLDWGEAMALRFHVLLTKADKLGNSGQQDVLRSVRKALPGHGVQLFSATRRMGIEQAQKVVYEWLRHPE